MVDTLNPLLGLAAGALTILSPCVLPLVPIVLGSAAQASRWAPWALAGGLVAGFTLTGFALATLGVAMGIDPEAVRIAGAAMLGLIGLVLFLPQGQAVLARAATPASRWASERQAGLERHGLAGQAAIGALLGIVWSPCVGPTLGAATVLASQGDSLADVAVVMLAFGLGIAIVLLVIAAMGRPLLMRLRGRMMQTGASGRRVLGVLLILVAVSIGTGFDRMIEAALIAVSPDWLVAASTAL